MRQILKDKFTAFSIHFCISATVVGAVFVIIFFLWYPKPYFTANGTWEVIRMLIAVDIVLGPLLTFILFKKGKPRLRMDLSMIAAIQISALVYGTYIIYGERPYYLVLSVDRFEMVRKKDVDLSKIQIPELTNKPIKGPIFAVAMFPEDEQTAAEMMHQIVMNGEPDIHMRPELFKKYPDNKDLILKAAKDITTLEKSTNKDKSELKIFLKKYAQQKDQLVFVPLVGKNKDLAMVLNKETALPIAGLDVNPWVE